ncbi:hypothetical protein D3C84_817120 [compost metagenome]
MHLSDRWFWKVPYAQRVAQVVFAFPQPVLFGRKLTTFLHAVHQVVPGRKVLTYGANDEHADIVVLFRQIQCVVEFGEQVFRFGIGVAGPVVADAGHVADDFVADVLVFHDGFPVVSHASNST